MKTKTCNINPIVKYIRVLLSLLVIGLGIYYRNWLGILGFFTLYTAFTGKCGTNFRFTRKPGIRLKEELEPTNHNDLVK